jgi:hypothetical protein
MRAFVTTRGNIGVAPGIGGLLIAVVLAPFVLAFVVLAALVSGSAAVLGAVVGHRVRVSPAALSGLGWTVAALIPAGLCVAFFGHADETLVEVGFYTALGAVPTSIALIAGSVFAEGR